MIFLRRYIYFSKYYNFVILKTSINKFLMLTMRPYREYQKRISDISGTYFQTMNTFEIQDNEKLNMKNKSSDSNCRAVFKYFLYLKVYFIVRPMREKMYGVGLKKCFEISIFIPTIFVFVQQFVPSTLISGVRDYHSIINGTTC